MNTILAVEWNVFPEMFSIGPLSLRYYGFFFVLGFIIGFFILKRQFRTEGISPDQVDNLVIASFIVAVISARLGHVFFYEPAYYLANPDKILKVWEGGVASHGAVIGLLIFFYYYARKKRWSFLWLLDRAVIPGSLVAALVRLGNLMNSEIYGHETSLPWGFIFVKKGELLPKHPTQIYEALAYLSLFVILLMIYRKKKGNLKPGLLTAWFLILMFSARFIIEFFKEVQVDFELGMFLNVGQLLSIPLIITGVVLLLKIRKQPAVPASKKK